MLIIRDTHLASGRTRWSVINGESPVLPMRRDSTHLAILEDLNFGFRCVWMRVDVVSSKLRQDLTLGWQAVHTPPGLQVLEKCPSNLNSKSFVVRHCHLASQQVRSLCIPRKVTHLSNVVERPSLIGNIIAFKDCSICFQFQGVAGIDYVLQQPQCVA